MHLVPRIYGCYIFRKSPSYQNDSLQVVSELMNLFRSRIDQMPEPADLSITNPTYRVFSSPDLADRTSQ